MEMSKAALAIISLISLATVHHAHAQDSPQDFLKAHNTARASVGVGPMIWDNTVAAFARSYINGLAGSCRMVHSGGPYGENLAWGSPDLAGTAAVKMWADERANYDYNSNSCVGGEKMNGEYKNSDHVPNFGAHPGGQGTLFRLVYKRMNLP